jgi:lactoylglutathione lyase
VADEAFPIIKVDDVAGTCRFYALLGFEQAYRFPAEGEPRFVTMRRGTSTIGFASGSAEERFAYWVYVVDVDATVSTLAAAGATVVDSASDRPWGERVATLRDPSGSLLHVGSPTSPAS